MSNPQQPELRRSEQTPGLTPDSIAGELDAKGRPDTAGPTGKVPAANRPGHHGGPDQDKPDLDAFAAKLGMGDGAAEARADDDQPDASVPEGLEADAEGRGPVEQAAEAAAQAGEESLRRDDEQAEQDEQADDAVSLPRPVEAAATAVGTAVGVAKAVGKRLPHR